MNTQSNAGQPAKTTKESKPNPQLKPTTPSQTPGKPAGPTHAPSGPAKPAKN